MTTTNPQSDEAPPFVTKADFEDFLASYKTDLEAFATKTDLEAFATKTDLEAFATKTDLEAFATKTDLEAFATKTDLEAFATKISKTLLDALAADKEDRLNIKVMADSRMDVLESILNSIRPPIRYDDSEESCMF